MKMCSFVIKVLAPAILITLSMHPAHAARSPWVQVEGRVLSFDATTVTLQSQDQIVKVERSLVDKKIHLVRGLHITVTYKVPKTY